MGTEEKPTENKEPSTPEVVKNESSSIRQENLQKTESVVIKTEITETKTSKQTSEFVESESNSENNNLKDEAKGGKSDDVDTLKCDKSLSEQNDPLLVEKVSKVPEIKEVPMEQEATKPLRADSDKLTESIREVTDLHDDKIQAKIDSSNLEDDTSVEKEEVNGDEVKEDETDGFMVVDSPPEIVKEEEKPTESKPQP